LAQGLLTNKYLHGIPEDSMIAKPHGFLKENQLDEATIDKIRKLNELAKHLGQTLAQMALSWILKDNRITTFLVGASKPTQLSDSLEYLKNLQFSEDEL
jgi:L-glyceraldehyde 3-phosphate reductase